MKKIITLAAAAILLLASCEELLQTFTGQGTLRIRFADGTVPASTKGIPSGSTGIPFTKAAFPDTNDFFLTITDSKGNTVFDGKYGEIDENYQLQEGTYTVSAKSCEFTAPLYDCPQFGDTQVASIKTGKTTLVTLTCSQLNAGIRLNIDEAFLSAYPDAVLYLKAASGRLMYSYNEKRIAYFQPGTVNLEMAQGSKESTLFTTRLEPQQILTLGVNVGEQASTRNGVSVKVDTTRNWTFEDFTLGGNGKTGSDTSKAMNVQTAKENTGEEDVWVYGYIVGGDLSSSKCSFTAPFSSRTNIVIADKSTVKDKSLCLSVQLAKGDIRDALNLVDHPENLGRQIFLKGDIVESYYGIPGLQNLTEFEYK